MCDHRKCFLEKQLVIMLLVLKAESVNTSVHVEQPPVNFQYTYIIVPKKKEMFERTIYSIKYNDETKRQSAIRIL